MKITKMHYDDAELRHKVMVTFHTPITGEKDDTTTAFFYAEAWEALEKLLLTHGNGFITVEDES